MKNVAEKKAASIICYLFIFLLLIIGIVLISFSYIPFETARDMLGKLAKDGIFAAFNKTMLIRARLLGFVWFIIGTTFLFVGKKVRNYFYQLFISFRLTFSRLKSAFISFIQKDKIDLIFLLLIIALSIIIRLFYINQPMRHDEAITFLSFVKKPLIKSLSDYSSSNNHLFHTFLSHIFYVIFGNREWVIRMPAFISGVLIIPASYFTTRVFYNKFAAILTAGLVAASSTMVEYSTNARGYTIIILFFLICLGIAKYLKDEDNKALWFIFIILSILGFFTLPMFLYPIGLIYVWLLLCLVFKDSKLYKKILFKNILFSVGVIILITLLLYTPAIIFLITETGIVQDAIKSHSLGDFIQQLPFWMNRIWSRWNRDIPLALNIIFVIGFFISTIFNYKLRTTKIPVVAAAIAWLAPVVLIHRPTMYERIWLFLLPIYLIVSASGLVFVFKLIFKKENILKFTAVTLAMLLTLGIGFNIVRSKSVYYSTETGSLQDAEEITIFLKDKLKYPDRLIVGCPSEWPIPYYFDRYGVSIDFLHNDLDKAKRAFVVINTINDQNLDYVLSWSNLSLYDFGKLELLKEYETAKVFITYRDIKTFISRFYLYFLDREPENKELNFWSSALEEGNKTIFDLVKFLISEQEFIKKDMDDSEFLHLLYKALLLREPDEEGYNNWLEQLKIGKSMEFVIKGFIGSEEFGNIAELYDLN
ncbi:MAG: DUF4214 domain-containing protein [Actinobacteria bacterium]|nr:DUF4214 domain-containing protein [Actinomycetota bacterium]